MQHVVATGHRLGPARIRGEIGAEQGQALAHLAGAALAQHGADIAFTRQVADGGPGFVPGRQQLTRQ